MGLHRALRTGQVPTSKERRAIRFRSVGSSGSDRNIIAIVRPFGWWCGDCDRGGCDRPSCRWCGDCDRPFGRWCGDCDRPSCRWRLYCDRGGGDRNRGCRGILAYGLAYDLVYDGGNGAWFIKATVQSPLRPVCVHDDKNCHPTARKAIKGGKDRHPAGNATR